MDSSARSLGSLGRNDKKGTASLRMTEEGNAARTPGRRDACPTKDRAFERGLWCGRDACPTKDRAFERGLWCRRDARTTKDRVRVGPQSRYGCELELDGNCVRDALHVIAR